MTNGTRLYILNRTMDSLSRYSGPVATFGEMHEGIDEDIWKALLAVQEMVKERISKVEQMDLNEEAAI